MPSSAGGDGVGEAARGVSSGWGFGSAATGSQTDENFVAGGAGWDSGPSPLPHAQPSTSPFSTVVLAALELPHDHSPEPSPCQ